MFNYTLIRNKEEFRQYCRGVDPTKEIVFDEERTGLKISSLLLGMSFYDGVRPPCFVPTNYFFKEGLSLSDIREVADEFFATWQCGIGHNAKYDWTMLAVDNMPDIQLKWDTQVMIHSYSPDLIKKLETRIKEDLKVDKKDFKEICGKKWENIDWVKDVQSGKVTLPMLAEYACEDTFWTYKIWLFYLPKIQKDPSLLKIHDRIEVPLIPVLRKMWLKGVRINVPFLNSMGEIVDDTLYKIKQNIYDEAGCEFNINSGKQKAEILFDKLRLPVLKMTKAGARSTDTEILEALAAKGHPIAQHMIEYSELQKLNSGYIQGIPLMVDEDGRLRADFNSLGTATGRYSSSNPNLQNQPNNKKFPVRKAFIPDPGNILFGADYSQIELRVMAAASGDPKFMAAFHAGEDIHAKVAKDLGIDRKGAKVINFGVLYGMGEKKLSYTLGISQAEAKSIIRGYETTYKGYAQWKKATEEFATKNGYVKTLFGRVRRLPGSFSTDKALFYGAMRRACNTIIQGSSADIIKLAMIKVYNQFEERGLGEDMLLQVHDELICEGPMKHAEESLYLLEDSMKNIIQLSVPLEVDGRIVTDWSQMKLEKEDYVLPDLSGNTLYNEDAFDASWLPTKLITADSVKPKQIYTPNKNLIPLWRLLN